MVFIDNKWYVIALLHTLIHTKWQISENLDGNHCAEITWLHTPIVG